jgi:glycosyltransferase involved in cell wall biosynthesis
LLRPADYVTCIYEGLRQEIIGRGVASSRVTVNPNAVDIDRFAPGDVGSGRLVEAGSPFRVGFIGSFYRYEGLDLLIEAAALAELMRMAASDPELCTKTVKNGHESVCAKRKWSASVARY